MAKIDRCAFFLATGDVIRTPGRSVPVTFVILPRIQQRAKASESEPVSSSRPRGQFRVLLIGFVIDIQLHQLDLQTLFLGGIGRFPGNTQ